MREDAPVCRTRTNDGLVLDVMPLDEAILGFSNRWYPLVLDTAQSVPLAEDVVIRAAAAPAFFTTKWEAFMERGVGDPIGSHDLEDLIMLVAGREELMEEIRQLPQDAADFVGHALQEALASPWFRDTIEGALPDARWIPDLVDTVHQRFAQLHAQLKSTGPAE